MQAALKVTLAAMILAIAAPASAQESKPDPDFAKAKQHYDAAEKAAAAGDWAVASREYGIAYEITRDPVLFYKIAESYDKAGNCKAANIYYGRYLREGNPNAEFKKTTEARLAACKAKLGEPAATTGDGTTGDGTTGDGTTGDGTTGDGTTGDGTTLDGTTGDDPDPADDAPNPFDDGAGQGPPSVDDSPRSPFYTAAWVGVGFTVAFATTAGVLALSANSREEDLSNQLEFREPSGLPPTYQGTVRERYEDLVDQGEKFQTYTYVALGAAGVAAIAAGVFFVLDATSAKKPDIGSVQIAPTATPDSAGVFAKWSF